jgi:hypothetical protein
MILCDIGNTTYHFLDGKKDFKVSVNDDITKLKTKRKNLFCKCKCKSN